MGASLLSPTSPPLIAGDYLTNESVLVQVRRIDENGARVQDQFDLDSFSTLKLDELDSGRWRVLQFSPSSDAELDERVAAHIT